MKVVRPEWLTESVRVGTLLPWRDFIYRPGGRVESMQGRRAQAPMHAFAGAAAAGIAPDVAARIFAPPGQARRRPQGGEDDGYGSDPGDIGEWEDSLDADMNNEPDTDFSPPPSPTPRKPPIAISKLSAVPLKSLATLPVTAPSAVNANPTTSGTRPPEPLTPSKTSTAADAGKAHHTVEPVSSTHTAQVTAYADGPNTHAARAMQNPAWRTAHTAAAPDFIEGYYRHSRLHHLSTWKAELRALVTEAQERAERGEVPAAASAVASNSQPAGDNAVSMRAARLVLKSPLKGKGKEQAAQERVIMHVDFDAFFVSAGLVQRPELRGRSVVVCHSQGGVGGASSTSEIASASYEAREFGVRNGMRCVFGLYWKLLRLNLYLLA
jgi:DNA repair protein REV1